MDLAELAREPLDVYEGKDGGYWHPDHGVLELPEGWEFLASGDASLTRTVKADGAYWTLWRPRGRNRPHRRLLGVIAPAPAIAEARAAADETAAQRATKRAAGARSRERAEGRYRVEFADAIRSWLAFRPEFAALADEIAVGAAARAAEVGSGRVGRTKTLTVDERAALAARAFIRHRYTDYDDQLFEGELEGEGYLDDFAYRQIRAEAHEHVDEFLADHREPAD
jgi:hypothetical protein